MELERAGYQGCAIVGGVAGFAVALVGMMLAGPAGILMGIVVGAAVYHYEVESSKKKLRGE